jgi:hypothetical protein
MPSRHAAGPAHDRAGEFCVRVGAACRHVRRDGSASPLAHALARAVQHHALSPYMRSCAAAAADPSRADARHEKVEGDWLELTPSLDRLVSAASGARETASAAAVLSCIAAELHGVPRGSHASGVINALWRDVFAAYAAHLTQWLEGGTVHDAAGDFFICRDVDGAREARPGMPPGHTFYVDLDRLPSFVTPDIAGRVFFAGHIVNCIQRFDVKLAPSEGEACRAADESQTSRTLHEVNGTVARTGSLRRTAIQRMVDDGRSVGLSLEAASLFWRDAASRRLSQLMPFSSLETYLCALREYLLLGNERFWRSFFAQLRGVRHVFHADMTGTEVDAAERCLERFVETSLADADADSGVPCILRVAVGSDGQLRPHFDVPFPASAVIANSAAKYSQAFAVAFGVRRVVHELEQCYSSILAATRVLVRARGGLQHVTSTPPARRTLLRRCTLLRMRMSRFMQAFDDYLQADVFETGFRPLRKRVRRAGDAAGDAASPSSSDLDDIVAAHTATVDGWVSQSLARSEAVQRRLDEICESCLGLCQFVERVVEGTADDEDRHGGRLELAFEQNAHLLVRVVSSLQGRVGSATVSALLLRLDWDCFYQEDRGDARCVFPRGR